MLFITSSFDDSMMTFESFKNLVPHAFMIEKAYIVYFSDINGSYWIIQVMFVSWSTLVH